MMKDYSKIVGKITSTPWMITPDALAMILELMEMHMAGTISQEEIRARYQASRQEREQARPQNTRGVGVLQLEGPIFPKANMMTELSGATSLEQFRDSFRGMMKDDNVSAILLDVDSPGGVSDLVPEMAAEVNAARGVKPVWAIANTAANSAAYYIASQAERLFSTPSGQVGSIGTYMVHRDDSKQKEMRGLKDTTIAAGRLKAVGEGELTQEGLAYLQDYIDSVNDDFVSAVARGRNVSEDTVRSDFGEGGIVTPRQAADKGMIDGVATFDEVVGELISSSNGGYISSSGFGNSNTANVRQDDGLDKAHGEPGPEGEPIPRDPPEKDDKAIKGGWRRDTPPIAQQKTHEGSEMNREQLVALATALGVEPGEEPPAPDGGDGEGNGDDELVGRIMEAANDLSPLMVATAEARDFLKDYPEQAARMAALETADRENKAHQFAKDFETLNDKDGAPSTKGYSALMISKIESAHIKMAGRTFTQADLSDLLTTAAEGVVDFGEEGSARSIERTPVNPSTDRQTVRNQFAELVTEIRTEDGLDRKAAIALAAEREPELAAAYARS